MSVDGVLETNLAITYLVVNRCDSISNNSSIRSQVMPRVASAKQKSCMLSWKCTALFKHFNTVCSKFNFHKYIILSFYNIFMFLICVMYSLPIYRHFSNLQTDTQSGKLLILESIWFFNRYKPLTGLLYDTFNQFASSIVLVVTVM